MRELTDMLKNALILLIIVWLVFAFFLGLKMAPNDDMKPRISAGDVLLYYRLDKTPKLNDVVIAKMNGTEYVGRVIAMPGDTVEITKEAALKVNGNMMVEDDIYFSTPYYEGYQEYPLTLGGNEYYILSDKREGGEDSRYFGPVPESAILGSVIGQFRRTGI